MAEVNRLVWEKGNFGAVAPLIWEVGEEVVGRVGVEEGEDVLDVACGTGNAAIRAAQRGGNVTGLDIVPDLLEQGRAIAAEEGVEVEFVEGDAEALQFDDASFDVVFSTFGCMFAPDHRKVAAEIARVLRPGGRIGLCNWTPEGNIGKFFKVTSSHMPPPPEGFQSPLMWGTEDHVREVFAGTGIEPEFDRTTVTQVFESPEQALDLFETKFGPVVTAKQVLSPEGKWEALRADILDYFNGSVEPVDGGVASHAEYLVVTGRKTT